jgi:hypothetical protein
MIKYVYFLGFELISIPLTIRKVASLNYEAFNDSVNRRAFEIKLFVRRQAQTFLALKIKLLVECWVRIESNGSSQILTSAQSSEIFTCLWTNVVEEFKNDTSGMIAAYVDVKKASFTLDAFQITRGGLFGHIRLGFTRFRIIRIKWIAF